MILASVSFKPLPTVLQLILSQMCCLLLLVLLVVPCGYPAQQKGGLLYSVVTLCSRKVVFCTCLCRSQMCCVFILLLCCYLMFIMLLLFQDKLDVL